MKAYSRGARAGDPSQSGPDTILSELTDCAITVGLLVAMLVVPALFVGSTLWLLSAAMHAMGLANLVPLPN